MTEPIYLDFKEVKITTTAFDNGEMSFDTQLKDDESYDAIFTNLTVDEANQIIAALESNIKRLETPKISYRVKQGSLYGAGSRSPVVYEVWRYEDEDRAEWIGDFKRRDHAEDIRDLLTNDLDAEERT